MEWLLDCKHNDLLLGNICSDYEEFVELIEYHESLEEGVEEYIRNSFEIDEDADEINVTLGLLAQKWLKEIK